MYKVLLILTSRWIAGLCPHSSPVLAALGGVNRTRSLDDGCAQKTYFRFLLISSSPRPTGMIQAAAQIEYMPNSSSHKVGVEVGEEIWIRATSLK